MKNAKFTSRRMRRRGCFFALLLAGIGILGEAVSAQTIRVDTTPDRAIKFDPDRALGSSMDVLQTRQVDAVYSEPILKESLSAGWGPITYRQNTELAMRTRMARRCRKLSTPRTVKR